MFKRNNGIFKKTELVLIKRLGKYIIARPSRILRFNRIFIFQPMFWLEIKI